MIVVTGAAGFIGSCLISKLNQEGFKDIIAVDDFSFEDKNKNLVGKSITAQIERTVFEEWAEENAKDIQFIFHIGARTDTAEFDMELLNQLNLDYSKMIWKFCIKHGIPVVYASSAATYGLGEHGYVDNHDVIEKLSPLNPYGISKNEFDKWALAQPEQPYYWAGLKFFNVYGPNEYHKGRMASVVLHAFRQINATEGMKLFRSHNPEYKNGEQLRDFVYVKDVVDVCMFLMNHRKDSGLYNLGSGQCRTFLDLTRNTFKALNREEKISFIDTPADIRDKYQYYTEADMSKLKSIGYSKPFYSLEEGVADYVSNYLAQGKYY